MGVTFSEPFKHFYLSIIVLIVWDRPSKGNISLRNAILPAMHFKWPVKR